MAVTAAQVVVSATAVALNPAETDRVSGSRLIIRNTHDTDALFVGPAGVTITTGYGIPAASSVTVDLTSGEQLFAVGGAANDITTHVLRIGV